MKVFLQIKSLGSMVDTENKNTQSLFYVFNDFLKYKWNIFLEYDL